MSVIPFSAAAFLFAASFLFTSAVGSDAESGPI